MIHNNEKYIISEFYEFKIDKDLITESEKAGKPLIMTGILQKADQLNRNGRVYPYDILKREVDKYMELVENNTAGGECVPAGTKIFTTSGWKNIEDVKNGQSIFTLNTDTNKLEIQNIENTIKKDYNDDMIHIYNNSSLDMMITKKHKVVLWDRNNKPYILTGEELFEKINNKDSIVNHSYIKHSGVWEGDDSRFFYLPDSNYKIKTEDWAAFLGIFISEGHCSRTKGGSGREIVGITQVKKEQKEKIKKLLDKLPFDYELASNNRQFLIKDKSLYNHLRQLGNSHEKYIPEYAKNWSIDLLNILFTWLLIGDGKNRKNKHGDLIKEYFTTSEKLSEDVSEIILKLGYGASINNIKQKDRFIFDEKIINEEVSNGDTIEIVQKIVKTKRLIKAENSKDLKIIRCKTTKGNYLDSRFVKAEKVSFNDKVYCISVPNKTWLMKYNNKIAWTHNCDHPDSAVVSLANVSHRVTEMWWQGKDLYGKVLIAEDTPAGKILKGLLKAGFMLGISSRGVGSVKNINGKDVVQEDFELIAFDFVSSPSTPGAYLFKEGKNSSPVKVGMIPLSKNSGSLTSNEVQEKLTYYQKINELANSEFWKKK